MSIKTMMVLFSRIGQRIVKGIVRAFLVISGLLIILLIILGIWLWMEGVRPYMVYKYSDAELDALVHECVMDKIDVRSFNVEVSKALETHGNLWTGDFSPWLSGRSEPLNKESYMVQMTDYIHARPFWRKVTLFGKKALSTVFGSTRSRAYVVVFSPEERIDVEQNLVSVITNNVVVVHDSKLIRYDDYAHKFSGRDALDIGDNESRKSGSE